jgi:TPR repeat protein
MRLHPNDMKLWPRAAAEQVHADTQYNLGFIYAQGRGVPKDYTESVKWYRAAAEQGHAGAQYNLGVMYANGEGVPKDLVQAHAWWNIAGAKGYENAKKYLAVVEKEMTDSQREKATDLAREMFARIEAKKK